MGKVIVAIILIAAIAVAVWFFFFRGNGSGTGKSGTTGTDNASEVVTSSQEAEPAQAEIVFAEVTVRENAYVYNGGEYQLDPLVEELKKLGENTKVRITDDGGLVDAKEALTDALTKNNIPYTDDTAV